MEPQRRRLAESELQARFATLPGLASARVVLLYVSVFPEELVTEPFLRRVLDRGQRLLCPRVDRRERRLRLYEVCDLAGDLERGTLGIPEPKRTCVEFEPQDVDWVLVPGVAFDGQGYRVGRGAGHYDRLLPRLGPEVPRWSLIFDEQWVDDIPVEPHDVPLDGVVSPNRTVVRSGQSA